ncbi:MAG: phosphoglycerate dehydrogenase, partial [Planctomycetota bacterium]
MQVLIADELPDICIEILEKAGLVVLKKPGIKAEELKTIINTCDGIILRSGTKITAPLLEKVDKLKAICRAGVGVDNVDVSAATKKGIVVMNTPEGNITSTAEHTVALLF